jgi:hypothetical protein
MEYTVGIAWPARQPSARLRGDGIEEDCRVFDPRFSLEDDIQDDVDVDEEPESCLGDSHHESGADCDLKGVVATVKTEPRSASAVFPVKMFAVHLTTGFTPAAAPRSRRTSGVSSCGAAGARGSERRKSLTMRDRFVP